MSKIIATGYIFGSKETIEITLEDERLVVVCKSSELSSELQRAVEDMLKKCIETVNAVGGTYYPPKNTLQAAFNGLQNNFFDEREKPKITVEGELEPIPYKEDRVY